MMNRDYVLPLKTIGPSNCIYDGLYYGTLKWTWNFDIHFPVVTIDYAENQTGVNITSAAGTLQMAEANLLKIAKLARNYIFERVAVISRDHLEYRIAHDPSLIQSMILFQIEILQTWGGYESLYRVTDTDNKTSIGQAAINYIKSTDVFTTYYTWRLDREDIRGGY